MSSTTARCLGTTNAPQELLPLAIGSHSTALLYSSGSDGAAPWRSLVADSSMSRTEQSDPGQACSTNSTTQPRSSSKDASEAIRSSAFRRLRSRTSLRFLWVMSLPMLKTSGRPSLSINQACTSTGITSPVFAR